jgi:hypothetical protein
MDQPKGFVKHQHESKICKLRAFTSPWQKNFYFTSLKTHFSILAINFYNIPHISLFILHSIPLKYYKIIIIIIIIFHTPPTSLHAGNTKQNTTQPPKIQNQTIVRATKLNHCNLETHNQPKLTTKSNPLSKPPLKPPQSKPNISAETHPKPKPQSTITHRKTKPKPKSTITHCNHRKPKPTIKTKTHSRPKSTIKVETHCRPKTHHQPKPIANQTHCKIKPTINPKPNIKAETTANPNPNPPQTQIHLQS